jgi:hypothetical protein
VDLEGLLSPGCGAGPFAPKGRFDPAASWVSGRKERTAVAPLAPTLRVRGDMRTVNILSLLSAIASSLAGSARATPPNDPPAVAKPGDSKIPKLIEARDIFWGGKNGEVHHGLRFFQDGRLLEGAEPYGAIDRPDLAKLYLDRANQANTQEILGGVLLVGGLITAGVGAAVERCSQALGCENHSATGPILAGLVGVVVGSALALSKPDPRPISDEELRRLVEAHNRAATARASTPTSPPIHAAPYLAPGGKPGFALEAAF